MKDDRFNYIGSDFCSGSLKNVSFIDEEQGRSGVRILPGSEDTLVFDTGACSSSTKDEENNHLSESSGSNTGPENALFSQVIQREFLHSLSQWQLIKLITEASNARKRKYKRSKHRKYGNINKGFTDFELEQFFACCRNEKARFAFQLMAYLGLRVSEVVTIKTVDIDLNHRRLFVQTKKANTGDSLYLHDRIYAIIRAWLESNNNGTKNRSKYVLFSGRVIDPSQKISPNWLRKVFREACILANLNETYGESDELNKPARRLHRLTTHSLRHYFITKVYKQTKDPIVAQKLARHTDVKSTQVYIHTAQNDLDGSMERAFERKPVLLRDSFNF